MYKFFIALIAVIVLSLIARAAIHLYSANRLATGLITSDEKEMSLSGCEGLHNCTASTATMKRNMIDSLDYTGSASEAMARYSGLIASQSGTSIVTQKANYLHATYKTTLLGYTDDLELLLDEKTDTLHVRSASRIGKSDLGANRKRIEALRSLANKKTGK